MLASDDAEEREWAVSKTIGLRKGAEYGETRVTVRYGKKPGARINMEVMTRWTMTTLLRPQMWGT